ncbi:MAG: PSD1 and planctomycete cytochrome C domain-containing protein [Gemmataceae bacterium]
MTHLSLVTPLLAALLAPTADPSAGEVRFFETKIRPLLAAHCFSCHGPDKQKGNLRLDSAEAFRRGGASGEPLVSPGQPDRSLFLRAVRHESDDLKMPPKGRLKDADVADLTRWVKAGAAFPRVVKAAGDAERHWAFARPADAPVPAVQDATWAVNALDRFLLAAMETKGVRPAADADRRTLLRRVAYDLTGLPPTPDEVAAFEADRRPDAYERLVDRLLASPAYGERWGRHWLDVARYADSNGLDENVAHGNAWRYRDWVIAAVNRDMRFDDFLVAQIAGDLLPADERRTDRLIATGFLALGPKVLAEVDERKMELDIVDEQIDIVGRAFLGLTLGCARCHDHKFDPVPMEDYYGLAGVFLSTRTMESFKKVARWHENPIGTPEQLRQKADHDARVTTMKARIGKLPAKGDDRKRLTAELAALEKAAVEIPTAMGVVDGKPTDAPLLRRGNHLTPGKSVPRRFLAVLPGGAAPRLPADHSGRLELARWLADPAHPLTARVLVNRLWRWHFGRGLVRSVDNFGLLGEKPTHPELLDHLAHRLVESGWSLKSLHRRIVLSHAYRLSSAASEEAVRLDPDNRLYARMPLRRLEAEAIRDGLLAATDGLDRTMGGSLLHVKNRDYFFDHTSKDNTRYDSPRRAVYLPVVRNNLYDVFGLFDATDATVSSGDRATTTVATQALFAMNSDLIVSSADRLAGTLLGRVDLDDRGRAGLLYLKAYGRPPAGGEADRVTGAVAAFDAALTATEPDATQRRRRAWAWVCHAVLSANEFITIR